MVVQKIVNNSKEFVALGPGWKDSYIHQDYPRTLYKDGSAKHIAEVLDKMGNVKIAEQVIYITKVVNSREEESKLKGWSRTPPEPLDAESEAISAEALVDENDALKAELAALKASQGKQHAGAAKTT